MAPTTRQSTNQQTPGPRPGNGGVGVAGPSNSGGTTNATGNNNTPTPPPTNTGLTTANASTRRTQAEKEAKRLRKRIRKEMKEADAALSKMSEHRRDRALKDKEAGEKVKGTRLGTKKGKGRARKLKAPPGVDKSILVPERLIPGTTNFYSQSGKIIQDPTALAALAVTSTHSAGKSKYGTTYIILQDHAKIDKCKILILHDYTKEERDDGQEEDDNCRIYHSQLLYNIMADYPRGYDNKYTGDRGNTSYPCIPVEAARTRLRFIDERYIDEDLYEAVRSSVANEHQRTIPCNRKTPDGSGVRKQSAPPGPLYKAFGQEVKAALEKYGFTTHRGKSSNPEKWHDMLVEIVLHSKRLHPRTRIILLIGTVDWIDPTGATPYPPEYFPTWTPLSRGKDHIILPPPDHLVRKLLNVIWWQEKRFLWHGLEAVVAGFRKNNLVSWAHEEVLERCIDASWEYYQDITWEGNTAPNPFVDDTAVCLEITDTRYLPGSTATASS